MWALNVKMATWHCLGIRRASQDIRGAFLSVKKRHIFEPFEARQLLIQTHAAYRRRIPFMAWILAQMLAQ